MLHCDRNVHASLMIAVGAKPAHISNPEEGSSDPSFSIVESIDVGSAPLPSLPAGFAHARLVGLPRPQKHVAGEVGGLCKVCSYQKHVDITIL